MTRFSKVQQRINGNSPIKNPNDFDEIKEDLNRLKVGLEIFKSYLSTVRILLYFVEIVLVFDWAVAVDSLLHF